MTVKKIKFDGIFSVGKKIATKNLTPNTKVYGEELVKAGKTEYRIWDYFRSKPAAAIKKGVKNFPIKKGDKILFGKYSGAEVNIDDQEYLIMKEEEVLGIIE